MADFLNSGEQNNDAPVACELLQLAVAECFIYKVPPLRSASGHRAEEWDLANPLITGCLRMYQSGETLRIALYSLIDEKSANRTDSNIKLFGECIIPGLSGEGSSSSSSGSAPTTSMSEKISIYVDHVVDSSRYYVLRLINRANKKTAMIGVGFRERETAFDFKSVLSEYIRRVDNMHNITPASATAAAAGGAAESGMHVLAAPDSAVDDDEDSDSSGRTDAPAPDPNMQLAFKEGETIKIKLKIPHNSTHKASPAAGAGTGTGAAGGASKGGAPILLAKPRSAVSVPAAPLASAVAQTTPIENKSTSESADGDEDDFADFVTA